MAPFSDEYLYVEVANKVTFHFIFICMLLCHPYCSLKLHILKLLLKLQIRSPTIYLFAWFWNILLHLKVLGYKKTNQTNLKDQNLAPYRSHVMPANSMHLLNTLEITLSFYNFVYRPYFGINRTFLVLTSPHCMGRLFRDTSLKCVAPFISIVYY